MALNVTFLTKNIYKKGRKKKMNYKEAPYSKFHKMLFLCAVLGQIACGFALGIAGTAVTEGKADLD